MPDSGISPSLCTLTAGDGIRWTALDSSKEKLNTNSDQHMNNEQITKAWRSTGCPLPAATPREESKVLLLTLDEQKRVKSW